MVQKNLPPSINSMKCQNRRYFSISADNALSSPFARFSCILSHVSSLLPPISHFPSPDCFPSSVSCLSSLVSRLAVSCLLSTVSRLQCCQCCRFSDFMEQISRLGQFSDLNALSGLNGLEANYFQRTWSSADMEFSRHGVQQTWSSADMEFSGLRFYFSVSLFS